MSLLKSILNVCKSCATNLSATSEGKMSRTIHSSSQPMRMKLRGQSTKVATGRVLPEFDTSSEVSVTDTPQPAQNGIAQLKQRLEDHLEGRNNISVDDNTSPGLARLRMTPGRLLKNTKEILMKKHEDVRQNADQLTIGGGVSLWPEMDKMRLTKGEIIHLVITSLGLSALVVVLFHQFHGASVRDLKDFTSTTKRFPQAHHIHVDSGEELFKSSLLSWHNDYKKHLLAIHHRFDMTRAPPVDILFLLCYIAGVIMLLHYLIDNMFAKSKLSPRRIKNWVILLVTMGVWTSLMLYWLVLAHQLEYAVENNVHWLSEILIDVVNKDYSLQMSDTLLMYWRTRCLPPTTHGVLSILGSLPVRDVMYYLQYYSLPVITVLLTPVVKLVLALYKVYRV